MNAYTYGELIFVSLLVCAIVFYLQQRNDTTFFKKQVFNLIIILTSAILVLDMLKFLIENGYLEHSRMVHGTVVGVYHLLMCILPMSIMKFCAKASGVKIGKAGSVFITIPTVVTLVLMGINAFVPFLFIIDRETCFHELPLHPLLWIAPFMYIAFALASVVNIYVKGLGYNKEIVKHILIFLIVAVFAATAATLTRYITPWPIMAVDIAYLYMTVQNKRTHDTSVAAFVDSLTGVKSAAAYRTALFGIDESIANGTANFGVAVMDISGLKEVNDKYGHTVGDNLLITASKFICNIFSHSPVFRIGGDEFVVILENSDYDNREVLVESFHTGVRCLNLHNDDDVIPIYIAFGMAIYKEEKEMHYADVFKLADRRMYEHKKAQKLEARI